MFKAILGMMPAIIVAVILLLINPIFGVLWIAWIVGVAIFTLKRNKN